MQNEAKDLIDLDIKFDGKEELPDADETDDNIRAIYTYYFEPKETFEEPEEVPKMEHPAEEEPMGEDEEFAELNMSESLEFDIAKEQIKRYNEGKMPRDWDPNIYLENLVNKEHISSEQKHIIEEAFLEKK